MNVIFQEIADEGKEDSDDGDNEGAELQYDSDISSEDELDQSSKYDIKGLFSPRFIVQFSSIKNV